MGNGKSTIEPIDPVSKGVVGAHSKVRDKYKISRETVGSGGFGVVRECMCRKTKKKFAIKSIIKSKLSRLDRLRLEIDILKEIKHPNIITLFDVHEDHKYLHLVTELCTGGELFDRIIDKSKRGDGKCFPEAEASNLIHSILSAISYCHDKIHVVHRDLKPENLIYETKADDSPIKLIDFGLSIHDTSTGVINSDVGTLYYKAPEVGESGGYSKSCDIWSIGVITYTILCGYPPFFNDSDAKTLKDIRAGKFDYPASEWDDISDDAKNFISSLIQKDPSKRPSADIAMTHKWIVQRLGKEKSSKRYGIAKRELITSTSPIAKPESISSTSRTVTFSDFLAKRKLKREILGFVANHISPSEVEQLGVLFKEIDKNHDGMLSLEEIESVIGEKYSSAISNKLKNLKEHLFLTGAEKINWKEFLEGMIETSNLMKDDLIRLAFEHIKSSEESKIQRCDLVELLGGESYASAILGEFDFDGDGAISYDEFLHIVGTEKDS
eukprot:CAMPEP_0184857882 /NCGR_PEP_ID=MMETSP0580-20130426/3024_1 /TAXON_ID=1118495 /ORGANISM="Dactyliosolen fragilissimus" /LENGTH=495 /DNA_ID=CAMNT_0027353731 /DNA_START=34 /DNA_END=1521 /DNA_ORIENTATION=+